MPYPPPLAGVFCRHPQTKSCLKGIGWWEVGSGGETIRNWVFKVGLGVNHTIKNRFGIRS
ncbi:MAG: hypothetical protein EWV89_21800 [Microcystis wesenbergii Mw_QC_B_20070930_S4]|jgi:hypothetical protein|nr:MAG: hypothetical protein EWV73_08905 [Microcystis wesenbergii Mw_QC_B_20070930_S4D]TRV07857.1 MAG: hypothetical protein EWV89_21800 [Microcystis wesenbergii Mw_QC_B_20070930_S4]